MSEGLFDSVCDWSAYIFWGAKHETRYFETLGEAKEYIIARPAITEAFVNERGRDGKFHVRRLWRRRKWEEYIDQSDPYDNPPPTFGALYERAVARRSYKAERLAALGVSPATIHALCWE